MKKTTSENLSKRLTQYGALSLAFAGIVDVNGQIVYHDITPDFDGSSDYFLNLNPIDVITPGGIADNIPDFRLFNMGSVPSSSGVALAPLYGNSVLGSYSIFYYPFALSANYAISNANPNWNNFPIQTLAYVSCNYGSSNWCDVTDGYLGLRFDIGGNTHYGWVKLDVDITAQFWSVKEYAFNATPNACINAGEIVAVDADNDGWPDVCDICPGFDDNIDTDEDGIPDGCDDPLDIDGNAISKIKIVALNNSIALFNLPQQTDYKVYNMSGQSVLNGNISSNSYVIEANTLANGIYIIELQDVNSNALIRKKIVL